MSGGSGNAIWDGVTRVESLPDAVAKVRQQLADAAKGSCWPTVFAILRDHPEMVNCSRPGSTSRWALLHQAAYNRAEVDVVERLVGLGAWRTLQNDRGERPVDLAVRENYTELLPPLTPQYFADVPCGILLKIQEHFHRLILGWEREWVAEHAIRLPELEPLLEMKKPVVEFLVPYRSISYLLDKPGVDALLSTFTVLRTACGGDMYRHAINSAGSTVVEYQVV
jgi:hypothetical protein